MESSASLKAGKLRADLAWFQRTSGGSSDTKLNELAVTPWSSPIRYYAKPGEFKPLHFSVIAKALLGRLNECELRATLAGRPLLALMAPRPRTKRRWSPTSWKAGAAGYLPTRGENVADV